MKRKPISRIIYSLMITSIFLSLANVAFAQTGNIDPVKKWAWGTNIGWINFSPEHGGVTVYADHLEGFAWAENVGWIRLGSHSGGGTHTYDNTTKDNYGVNRDALGNLSGYAWGTNIGWINFNPSHGGVIIDPNSGSFDGSAWAENVGWIKLKNGSPAYNVATSFISPTEQEPNNEYGDPGIIVVETNTTCIGEVHKPGDLSDLWYIKEGASGPLTLKNISDANVWMSVSSFSNDYGGPGNMIKHIRMLKSGKSGQVNLNSSRYYVINVSVPFRGSTGGDYKFVISGDWTVSKHLVDDDHDLLNVAETPNEFSLFQNYPNPFNPTTKITFDLPQAGFVEITIFNTMGHKVRTLYQNLTPPGRHSVAWDATDDSGSRVASGIYLYKIKVDNFESFRKMLLMK
jgi:hypothetical protein